MGALHALQRGDPAASAAALLEAGRLDPYNAAGAYAEATFRALLGSDRSVIVDCLEALLANGSHAAIARLAAESATAGIAVLEGDRDAGRAGLLAAYGELRDLGAARSRR